MKNNNKNKITKSRQKTYKTVAKKIANKNLIWLPKYTKPSNDHDSWIKFWTVYLQIETFPVAIVNKLYKRQIFEAIISFLLAKYDFRMAKNKTIYLRKSSDNEWISRRKRPIHPWIERMVRLCVCMCVG